MSQGNPSKGDTRIPMPPPEPAAAAPVAQAPAAPAAPAPVAAAPAAPAPVAEYAADTALVRLRVDGRDVDVPVGELKAVGQLRTAAEKRFADANALKTQYAGDIAFANEMRSLSQTNPEEAARRFQQLTGRPLPGATPTQADDENVDPAIRQVRAQLALLQTQNAELTKFAQRFQTQEAVDSIRSELQKFPLYQGDAEALRQAEVVVAAYLVNNPDRPISEMAGELHAMQSDMLRRHQTTQRDTRAANAEALASVPPSAGSPGLTQPTPFKATPGEMQRGSWKQKLDVHLANALKGT